MKTMPINEIFLSSALLQCLRTWKERVGEAPLCLGELTSLERPQKEYHR